MYLFYIDESGNLIIPCQYGSAGYFNEGIANVINKDYFSYYIDKENNYIALTVYNKERIAAIYRSITLAKEAKFEEALNCIRDIAYNYHPEDISPLERALYYAQESLNYTELVKLLKSYYFYFKSLDGQGSSWACVQLGLFYEKGLGVEPNIKDAFEYYNEAAILGDEEGKKYLDKLIEKYPDLKDKSSYYNFEDEDWG